MFQNRFKGIDVSYMLCISAEIHFRCHKLKANFSFYSTSGQ